MSAADLVGAMSRARGASHQVQAQQCVAFDAMARRDDITRHETLRTVIQQRRRDVQGCMSLPASIIFFALYAFSMRLHEDITNVFLLESAIRIGISQDLQDIKTISTMWQWLQGPFTDKLFVQEDLYGEPLQVSEWSRVLKYSQLQGSVVLKQSRASSLPWGVNLTGADGSDSYMMDLQSSGMGFVPISKAPSVRRLAPSRRLSYLRPELEGALPGAAAEEEATFEAVLYPTMPMPEIRKRLSYLEKRGWLDEETDELTVKALLLNAELGRPRLEQLLLTFSFSRGGGIFHKIALESLFLKPFPSYMSIMSDGLWTIMLMGITVRVVRKACMQSLSGRMGECTQFSNILEWTIVLGGWLNIGLFWYVNKFLLADLKDKLYAVVQAPAGAALEQASERLHESAEAMVLVVSGFYRLGMSWYNLVLMFRFFVTFRAQPRLGMVVNTLKATSTDLLHFAVVFVPTLCAYIISGNYLFGRRMQEFSTLQAAAGTCFRIMIENEFDWEVLSEEHFFTTAIWVWSFLVIVVLIMLNIVLAIILDIYNEVRGSVDASDSIFVFLSQLCGRLWKARDWVNDAELHSLLAEMDGSATITKTDLKEMLPKISGTQADMLFEAARNHMAFQLEQDMHRSFFLKIAQGIKTTAQEANALIKTEMTPKPDIQETFVPSLDAAAEAAPTAAPSTSGGRMQGTARPFPGMPAAPGGFCPPLLAPEKASHGEDPDAAGRPAWLRDIDEAVDLQAVWMMSLQAQLQEIQWSWRSTQQACGGGATHGRILEEQLGKPKEDITLSTTSGSAKNGNSAATSQSGAAIL